MPIYAVGEKVSHYVWFVGDRYVVVANGSRPSHHRHLDRSHITP